MKRYVKINDRYINGRKVSMRIIICDDEREYVSIVYYYVKEYIETKKYNIDIKAFNDPRQLLDFEKKNGKSDIYLLDIIMTEVNGIDIGKEIYALNKKALIIYITSSKDFYPEAFSVKAFSYLVKPVEKQQLFRELDECFERIYVPRENNPVIPVRTPTGIVPVSIDKINAVDYLDHRLRYHLSDGSVIEGVYIKLPFEKQADSILKLGVFVNCAKTYIVNLKNVYSVSSSGFIMKNGDEIHISRRYTEAKNKFLDAKLKGVI